MRWPIRHQILLPFLSVVLLAVVSLTGVAALLAARRSDQQTFARLQNTIDVLAHANFPYTGPVLEKIRGLSGAHFVGCDGEGKIIRSTLPEGTTLSLELFRAPIRHELSSLAAQPTVELDGVPHFAARLQARGDVSVRSLVVLYPVNRWSRDRREAALLPLAVGGASLVVTSIVALWLAQRFSRRLRRLQEQVAAIAGGEFREIRADQRHDEIQDLVSSVNRMAVQLRQQQQTIRISERTQLLAQLAGGLAHQLRNAVTGARMALQLHQRRCHPDPADQSLTVALRQLSLTETQVRGLLSLGRAERRAAVACDVGRLAGEIAELLQPTCEHAGVSFSVDIAHDGPFVALVEIEALRAAVLNLAQNAIEAAGANGSVSIHIEGNDGGVIVDVCDSGAGPPSHLIDSLFDPFVTGKPEGVGLGLALARQVAGEHGGTLAWFRDEVRTVFRLTLAEGEVGKPCEDLMTGGERPSTALHRRVESTTANMI